MISPREELMIRVRTVQKIRAFFASPVSNAAAVIAFILCGSIFVSFSDVVANIMAHAEWGGRFSYTYSSLLHARMMVQILAVLTSLSALALCGRLLFRLRQPAYFVGSFLASRLPLKYFKS